MMIPLLPLIAHLMPAKGGIYRAKDTRIQRLLFGRIWVTVSTCAFPAEAQRIASELNAYAAR